MHTPQVIAALTSVCSATLLLQPIQGLQKEMAALSRGQQGPPHGQLHLHLKRQTGRVRVEAELYSLQAQGGLDCFAPPQEVITAQLLAAHAVNKLGMLPCSCTCTMVTYHSSGHDSDPLQKAINAQILLAHAVLKLGIFSSNC